MTQLSKNIISDICSKERRLSAATLRTLGRATSRELAEAEPGDADFEVLLKELRSMEEKASRLQTQMGIDETSDSRLARLQLHAKIVKAFNAARRRDLAAAKVEADALRHKLTATVAENHRLLQIAAALVNFPGRGQAAEVCATASEARELRRILNSIGEQPSPNAISTRAGIQNAANFTNHYCALQKSAWDIVKAVVARIPKN